MMKFDELDAKMRVFESQNDTYVLPEVYMVARMDGRSFTRLTKEVHAFEAPFDVRFRDCMVQTTMHLMQTGFRVVYGFTESDEISLLLHKDENLFGRKLRKMTSILSGEASAKFSLLLGDVGCFDARISQLPTMDLVIDYFRWRNEDAHRNALNAHCYWMLRRQGKSAGEATAYLSQKSVAEKNELLFQNGINFDKVETWQKRGIGFSWGTVEKEAYHPIKKEKVTSIRKEIKVHYDLPMKEQYSEFLREICAPASCGLG